MRGCLRCEAVWRLPDLRQHVNGSRAGIQLSPAVIRDPDSCEAAVQSSHRVLRSADALDGPGTLPLLAQPLGVLPTDQLLHVRTLHITRIKEDYFVKTNPGSMIESET